ncbi:MAG TPA: carbohydrate ABC transporter permease [Ruminiclostridium sp.]
MGLLNSEKSLKTIAYIFSSIFIILIFIPLIYMGILSLQDDITIYSVPPKLLPVAPTSINIVIDYTKYKAESEAQLKDLILRDSTVAMYSTIYELNKTVIGEIKVYGIMDGKTIYYSRSHGLLLKLERQAGVYKLIAATPKVLLADNRYLKSAKDIGYSFNINGIRNKSYNSSTLGKDNISSVIGNNLNGTYKISGDYKGSIINTNILLAIENYKYYFLAPTFIYSGIPFIKQYSFLAFFFNTILTVVWATVCQVVLCSISAYPLARLLKKRTSDLVMIFFLATMMIPWICIMIPQLILMRNLGFENSYAGMLFPWLLPAPFYILLFKGFFERIPSSFFEAAKIDGAGEWYIFTKICMAMSKPIITLITLQAFISGWGDFMWYYLIANRPELWTLNVAMYTIGGSSGGTGLVKQNFIMGLAFIMVLPVLVLVAIFSKQIKVSVISSGIKE